MKTIADLKALLGDINAEIVEKRVADKAARATELTEKIGVVMQLLPLVTTSTKAAAAVRDQMYSVPKAKAAVREYLRGEFLGFSGPYLPHATAQVAAAVGELAEVSAEKFAEIRENTRVVYEHRKTAHEGKWQNGCQDCAMVFTYDSKADGALHRYIALTHWSGALMKERYDRNRLPLLPNGRVGPIGKAMTASDSLAEKPTEMPVSAPPAESRKVRRAGKFAKTEDGPNSGRPTSKPRGGAGSDEAARAMREGVSEA